jgi:hypothetical protein
MLGNIKNAAALFKWREFAIAYEACPLCGFLVKVRLRREEMGVRCLRCGASAVTQSFVDVLRQECSQLCLLDVYELSAAGPLVRWLKSNVRSLTTSELLDDTPPGVELNGITCQDVQRLTYHDGSFDVCTSTEVFEHVEDDIAGFREILHVLREKRGQRTFSVLLGHTQPTRVYTSSERSKSIGSVWARLD